MRIDYQYWKQVKIWQEGDFFEIRSLMGIRAKKELLPLQLNKLDESHK